MYLQLSVLLLKILFFSIHVGLLVAGSSVSTEKLCDSIWYHCVGGHKKFWGVP